MVEVVVVEEEGLFAFVSSITLVAANDTPTLSSSSIPSSPYNKQN